MSDTPILEDLIYLLRCALSGQRPDPDRVLAMDLEGLYRLSQFHSLGALVYTAVESAFGGKPPRDRLPAGWRQTRDAAQRNALLFAAERRALETYCEEAGIWYLPLKGTVLQTDYPRLGLREMVDNDILFDPAYRRQIHDWFVARGYRAEHYGVGPDDGYQKPPVFNFEMHTALFERERFPQWAAYFDGALRRLLPREGTRMGRCFTGEDFFLYLLAHMYKHYAGGGTGLRSLVDVYVFRQAHGQALDPARLQEGLAQLGLEDFARRTCRLADRVLGGTGPLAPGDRQALGYYLTSGTHGTRGHRMQNELRALAGADRPVTNTTRARYFWHRLFPDRLALQYWCSLRAPFFLRHPRLLPLARPYRLVYSVTHGKQKNALRELHALWKS